MYFASDNAGPAHPKVLEALVAANTGYAMGYGADPIMEEVRQMVRDMFEAPDAAVYLTATGTAANAILLATLANPWDTIFCAPMAHIQEDECNAPEFYSNAKLTLVPAVDAKMTPDALRAAMLAEQTRGVHGPQRGPVSITQVTEKGTIHTVDEIRALSDVAREFGSKVHLDGARFCNALVALGCTAAEMTWKAGIDIVSFGGTKNGLLGVEAVIIFDPVKAWEFELRRKRGGHLFSKHRYLSAQMEAYLTNNLWIRLAKQANIAGKRLEDGLTKINSFKMTNPRQANMLFCKMSRAAHNRAVDGGAKYYMERSKGPDDELIECRLVCSWSTTDAEIERFVALAKG